MKPKIIYPQGPCTATTRTGNRCRHTDIFENGRCAHHGGSGMFVHDRRWIERAHSKLQRIQGRAARLRNEQMAREVSKLRLNMRQLLQQQPKR